MTSAALGQGIALALVVAGFTSIGFFIRRLIGQVDAGNKYRQNETNEKLDDLHARLTKFDGEVWQVLRKHDKRLRRLERPPHG